MSETWDSEAENWIKWVRTPGHDVFSVYSPSFFDEVVPTPSGLALEVGCGEGRVVRNLKSLGHVSDSIPRPFWFDMLGRWI